MKNNKKYFELLNYMLRERLYFLYYEDISLKFTKEHVLDIEKILANI